MHPRPFGRIVAAVAAIAALFAIGTAGATEPNACKPADRFGLAVECSGRLGLAIRTIDRLVANPLGPGGRALSFEAAYPLMGDWRVAGFYLGDVSRFGAASNPGLGLPVTRAADSLGLGVERSAAWLSGDRLFLGVSHQLESTDPARLIGMRPSGLRAQGRDLTTELRYLAPILKSSQVGLSLVNRAGLFEAVDERIITIRFATQF